MVVEYSRSRMSPEALILCVLGLGFFFIMLVAGCGRRPKPEAPPRSAEAGRMASQGSHWFRQGCFEKAERYFYQALEASRLIDDLEAMVRTRNNLGAVALAQGHLDEAGEHLNKALELNVLVKIAREQSLALGNLGSLAYKAGRQQEAEDLWEKAVVVAEADAGEPGLALHLNNLGMLRLEQGRFREAEESLQRAMSVSKQEHASTRANTQLQLGLLAQAQGDLAKAEKHLRMALDMDRAAENPVGIAKDLEKLGLLYQEKELWQQAAAELDRAIRLYATLGDTGKVHQINDLLKLNQEKGGLPNSMQSYQPLLVQPDEIWQSPLCR